MIDRRTFLRNFSLLTLGGIASQKMTATNTSASAYATDAVSSATSVNAGKKIGLQTYSLGQELLQDLPTGLNRLAKMGYTDLEIFGYRGDSGKFGDYNPQNTLFIAADDYKKMADDAGLKISSSHLTPSVREYTKANMSQFEDFWKKATEIHSTLGVSYMVQPSLPRIENEDDAKVVCEIFNRAGEITKEAGILWGYHNHSNEFKRVLKAGEQPEERPNPRNPKGTYIEDLFMQYTDPDKVMFELDVYWTVMGQQDPIEWMDKYAKRIKLLHIKDRWILNDSGMMNFPNIFKKADEIGISNFYVELEAKQGHTQFEGVEKSVEYLLNAPFVK